MSHPLESEAPASPRIADERCGSGRESQERRAAVRVVCEIPVTACAMAQTDTLTRWAIVRDASKHGVGLLAPREYAVGTVLLIWREWRNPEHSIIATVVHSRREPSGWFHGCRRIDGM
jgi:hypothetical protein